MPIPAATLFETASDALARRSWQSNRIEDLTQMIATAIEAHTIRT
jgi:hypothetical protein